MLLGLAAILIASTFSMFLSAEVPTSTMITEIAGNSLGGSIVTEKAMFGAGCFWGVEAGYNGVKGVISTEVGYSGGATEDPTYRAVCNDNTGHAEVILIEFDPSVISYDKLVDVFFNGHDPTTMNRQGPDYGSQYRSAIFYFDENQKATAERLKEEFDRSGKFKDRIVTEIARAGTFYRAEEYHQQYNAKNNIPACGFHLEK